MSRIEQHKQATGRITILVWTVVGILLLGSSVLAINVTTRVRRVLEETNQIRSAVQDAVKRQEMIVKVPARREFSSAFLQMAFGDNPVLLEQVKGKLQEAVGRNPSLQRGDVAMMLVTYRAEGEVRDVAIQVFGDLNVERMPAFSTEGYWKGNLPEQYFKIGQSWLSMLGREVQILGTQEVVKRQREVLDASTGDKSAIVEDYLHDPVSFIAVVPDPSRLFADQFRNYMAAVIVKGKLCMDESRFEFVALSTDPNKAQALAQTLSDTRAMALGTLRVRFGGSGLAESAFEQVTRSQIRADGPAVVINSMMPKDVLQNAIPKLIHGLSKGVGRIKRGPGYPS